MVLKQVLFVCCNIGLPLRQKGFPFRCDTKLGAIFIENNTFGRTYNIYKRHS